MNAIKRIGIAALILSAFPFGGAFAEEVKSFTIEEAVSYANENNLDLASAREQEKQQRYNVDSQRVAQKNMKKSDMGGSSISAYMVSSGYTYNAAKVSYAVAKRSLESAQDNLADNVRVSFYACQNQKRKIELAQNSVQSAKERLEYATVRFNMGLISKLDLTSFELALQNAQNNLNAQERALEADYLSFKSLINYPLDEPVNVLGTFQRIPMDDTPLDTAKEKMAKSQNRANLDDNFYLSELEHTVYTDWYTYNEYDYHIAKYKFEMAKNDYKKNLNSMETGLYSAYSQMLSAYENLDYLDKSIDYNKSLAEAARLRYEMGTITADDYNTTVQNYENMLITLTDTELGAYQASQAYHSMFGYENTVFKEKIR